MREILFDRRKLLIAGVAGASGLILPAVATRAAGLAPTPTMRGGANNYIPGAPIVEAGS